MLKKKLRTHLFLEIRNVSPSLQWPELHARLWSTFQLSPSITTHRLLSAYIFFFFWKPSIVSPTQGDREKHGRKEARHIGWAGTDKWKEPDRLRNQKGGVKEKLAREKGRKREIRKAKLSVIQETPALCSNPHGKYEPLLGKLVDDPSFRHTWHSTVPPVTAK